MSNITKVSIEKEYKKILMTECIELFLKEHPELSGMKLTEKFMLRRIIDYYRK